MGKPTAFGDAGATWSKEGWLVPVKFTELKSPIRPKDHIELLAPTLPPPARQDIEHHRLRYAGAEEIEAGSEQVSAS